MFVIARNSSFQYKGKAIDVRQIGRELGVGYVIEGSVRCDANRIRISAQLVETRTGAHRWGERYDRELKDVFSLQDEITRTIVAVVASHVNKAEAERTLLKPPAAWAAYDYFLRAAEVSAPSIGRFGLRPSTIRGAGSIGALPSIPATRAPTPCGQRP